MQKVCVTMRKKKSLKNFEIKGKIVAGIWT